MSNHILRDLTTSVQSSPFITIMINEATDKSNTEQATVVLRWVSDSLKVNEDYVGLYEVPSIDADTLTSAIKDVLLRMNLSVMRIRGQCYDGAHAMSRAKSGVAQQKPNVMPTTMMSSVTKLTKTHHDLIFRSFTPYITKTTYIPTF